MADMSKYSNDGSFKLRGHLGAIRENQVSVACMILYLHGYDFELTQTGSPLASAARECLQELDKKDMVGIYSCSTTVGGIWSTSQRYMLKYGEVRGSP
jgi:hypothetical protein